MTVDREQTRRNERARLVLRVRTAQVLQHRGHDGLAGSPDETCVRCNADRAFDALLAELEQAERELEQATEGLVRERVKTHEQRVRAEQAERERDEALRERDLIGAALGEPCAECGHVDWRSDGYADRYFAAEAQLAAVPALVEALERIRDGFDGDEFQDPADAYDQHRDIAREALAAYEQEQKP